MQKIWPLRSLTPRLTMGLLLAIAAPHASAAPDPGRALDGPATAGLELIAFEAPGCAYCPIFRRDVAPTYGKSRAGKTAPLRFVDLNDAAADRVTLSSPITVVPTLVLVRDGVEIGRIAGYVGPANVYHILNTILPPE
ncbi:MAG TPA: thioredoxin family protein [Hyphomicrobium sp.]|nr:thioredoxin family protein [Hyphomicrobium sp.]HRO49360.1 thioredoxin family protein [Hyphomicrobium sp.]